MGIGLDHVRPEVESAIASELDLDDLDPDLREQLEHDLDLVPPVADSRSPWDSGLLSPPWLGNLDLGSRWQGDWGLHFLQFFFLFMIIALLGLFFYVYSWTYFIMQLGFFKMLTSLHSIVRGPVRGRYKVAFSEIILSMVLCKKDVTPLLTHWSYVFFALTHGCDLCHAFVIVMINVISFRWVRARKT